MVQIKVKPHPYFKRDNSDIQTDLYITLSQAVLGAEMNVKTLYGDIKMKIDPGSQNEERKKIANYVRSPKVYLNCRGYKNCRQIIIRRAIILLQLRLSCPKS